MRGFRSRRAITIAVVVATGAVALVAVGWASRDGGGGRSLGDRDNGKTIDLRLQETMTVRLHSTYWEIERPEGASLRVDDKSYRGGSCMAGVGCGTVTMHLTAVAPGRTSIVATRLSCGEVLLCPEKDRRWSVDVVVGAVDRTVPTTSTTVGIAHPELTNVHFDGKGQLVVRWSMWDGAPEALDAPDAMIIVVDEHADDRDPRLGMLGGGQYQTGHPYAVARPRDGVLAIPHLPPSRTGTWWVEIHPGLNTRLWPSGWWLSNILSASNP